MLTDNNYSDLDRALDALRVSVTQLQETVRGIRREIAENGAPKPPPATTWEAAVKEADASNMGVPVNKPFLKWLEMANIMYRTHYDENGRISPDAALAMYEQGMDYSKAALTFWDGQVDERAVSRVTIKPEYLEAAVFADAVTLALKKRHPINSDFYCIRREVIIQAYIDGQRDIEAAVKAYFDKYFVMPDPAKRKVSKGRGRPRKT